MKNDSKKENKLINLYPELAEEWHPTKNIDIKLENATIGSDKKAWWICPKGHEYEQKISRRTKRSANCPYCSGHKVLVGYNDLETVNPKLAKEWHPTKNGDYTPKDFTAGSGKRVWWKCPIGHEYQTSINDRNRKEGTNCPICNKRNESSFKEQAIYYYVKKLFPNAKNKYNELFSNSMELDIYIPEIKVGIEYDGANWHKSEEEHKRERKKYNICKENGIILFRVKEYTKEKWNDSADAVWYIKKSHKNDELEEVIKAILTSIDVNSNIWTRKKWITNSIVDVNIERDRTEILEYLSEIENSLEKTRKDVIEKWNYEKNGNLKPNMFSVSSNQIVWWKCPKCGHEWQSSINSMTRKGRLGCAECSRIQKGKTFTKQVVGKVGSLENNNPELAKEWNYEKNIDLKPSEITKNYNKKVWWKCKTCGYEWQASPNNRSKGVGCPCCSGRVPKIGTNDLETLFPTIAAEWDYEKNGELKPNQFLPKSGKKVWWKCKTCGQSWYTEIRIRTNGHNCPKCSKITNI